MVMAKKPIHKMQPLKKASVLIILQIFSFNPCKMKHTWLKIKRNCNNRLFRFDIQQLMKLRGVRIPTEELGASYNFSSSPKLHQPMNVKIIKIQI